jgi:histone arginine demethylase JMJD6
VKILDQDIDRHDWATLGRKRFREEYLLPLRPVVITGGISHWRASGTWTPDFFRQHYGDRDVTVDDQHWRLTDLLDRIEASSATTPAPYLRNEWLAKWPKQVLADVQPMPQCSLPNWLDSWAFPSRDHPTFIELYIGGAGANFPILHFDNWHTHAFLMQLYGEKEYLALAPDQGRFLYPQEGAASNKSGIKDALHPDLDRFPLFAQAQGIRFTLSPGETLFVPAGWWHTARILTTSITVSINGANTSNWKSFAKDYCGSISAYSRAKAAVLLVYMNMLGELLELGSWFAN